MLSLHTHSHDCMAKHGASTQQCCQSATYLPGAAWLYTLRGTATFSHGKDPCCVLHLRVGCAEPVSQMYRVRGGRFWGAEHWQNLNANDPRVLFCACRLHSGRIWGAEHWGTGDSDDAEDVPLCRSSQHEHHAGRPAHQGDHQRLQEHIHACHEGGTETKKERVVSDLFQSPRAVHLSAFERASSACPLSFSTLKPDDLSQVRLAGGGQSLCRVLSELISRQ